MRVKKKKSNTTIRGEYSHASNGDDSRALIHSPFTIVIVLQKISEWCTMLASASPFASEAHGVDALPEEGSPIASEVVHNVDISTDEGELIKRMETTTSPLDSEVHDVVASTDEGELFKRIETTTSPLDSEMHDGNASTEKGIFSTESRSNGFPGQGYKERKSVKWQVADTAPERTGPWKAPKRKKKSLFGNLLRKIETHVPHFTNRELEPHNLPSSGPEEWSEEASKHPSDAVPAQPAHRQTNESPTFTRRRSLLNAFFPSRDYAPSAPSRRESNENPTCAHRISLLEAVLPNRDAVPAQPARRQSNENKTRRKLSLTSMFSSNREISGSETPERWSGGSNAPPTPLPQRQSSIGSVSTGEGVIDPDDDIDLDDNLDGDSEPDGENKNVHCR
jgi:hypothetical protein